MGQSAALVRLLQIAKSRRKRTDRDSTFIEGLEWIGGKE
jgi:hypothetical protein